MGSSIHNKPQHLLKPPVITARLRILRNGNVFGCDCLSVCIQGLGVHVWLYMDLFKLVHLGTPFPIHVGNHPFPRPLHPPPTCSNFFIM